MNKNIAIVAGEPFSINSEIIAKSWKKIKKKYKKNLFIIGNYSLIKKQWKEEIKTIGSYYFYNLAMKTMTNNEAIIIKLSKEKIH